MDFSLDLINALGWILNSIFISKLRIRRNENKNIGNFSQLGCGNRNLLCVTSEASLPGRGWQLMPGDVQGL